MAKPFAQTVTKPEAAAMFDESQFADDVGGGTLVKWDKPKVVIGKYVGMIELPPYGSSKTNSYKATLELVVALGDIAVGEPVSFFAPAALKSRLENIKQGTVIRIEHDGSTTPSAAGRPVKNFTVRPLIQKD